MISLDISRPTGYLAEFGQGMIGNGYHIIPIEPGGKRPRRELGNWREIDSTPSALAQWIKQGYDQGGVGIDVGKSGLAAVDIDVTDESISKSLAMWCEAHIGFAPIRIGKAPKQLLVYRSGAPFRKITSKTYEDERGERHRLEILGDGQQFVAYGIHPGTERPYHWISRETPADLPVSDLPVLTASDARRLIVEFETLALATGWGLVSGAHTAGAMTHGEDPDDPFAADVGRISMGEDELRGRLMLVPNADEHDHWVQIGMALFHQFEGDDAGLDLWKEWSATAGNYDESECEKRWRSFDISTKGRAPITARYILKYANEAAGPDTLGDLSNGRRLAARYRGKLLYCHALSKWLRWDGLRWAWCEGGEAMQSAKRIADDLLRETGASFSKSPTDAAKRTHAQALAVHRTANRLTAMLNMASSEPEMGIANPGLLDPNPWLLGVRNGVVDLKVGTLRPASPEMLITKQAGARFDRQAECPRWLQFLGNVFEGDTEKITFLQRALGYTLTGLVTEEKLFFMFGHGANGKSVLANVVAGVFGEYAVTVGAELLARNSGCEGDRFKAKLPGARLALANEVGISDIWDDQRVKELVSRERVPARQLYSEAFDFMPTHKLWIRGNHQPGVLDSGDGLWRRIVLIPFKRLFSEDERDPNLEFCLLDEERDGVLMWMVDGCLAWQRGGLRMPASIARETSQYRKETDLLGGWLEERCERNPTQRVEIGAAYQDYREMLTMSGVKPPTRPAFTRQMTTRGFECRPSNGKRYFHELALLERDEWTL